MSSDNTAMKNNNFKDNLPEGVNLKSGITGLVIAGLFIAVFWGPIQNLLYRWGASEELSHSYIIPFLSLWLLWDRREALLNAVDKPWLPAGVVALSGLLLAVAGAIVTIPFVSQVALVIFFLGLPGMIWGRHVFMLTLIPMLYLGFMVPPPHWVITILSGKFQFMSSELGVMMIRLMNIPVYLSGNIIDLGEYKLQVVEACSGLRYLFPFLSLGAIAAYFYKGSWWERAFVVLVTIPITILMNSFRIAITGALVNAFGAQQADGFLHLFEGWVVFVLCLAVLYGVIWLMSKFIRKEPMRQVFGMPVIEDEKKGTGFAESSAYKYAFSLIGILAICGVMVLQLSGNVMQKPERLDLATLPFEFESWSSADQTVTTEVANVIGADDFIITNMVDPEGQNFNMYIAYVAEQKEGKSWHSPRQCLPGGGWEMTHHTIEKREMSDGRTLPYNRIIIQQGEYKQLVYYWYDQRGRLMANEFVMKIQLIRDALFRKRKDGAMIRVMTLVAPEEDISVAEERLQGFMGELHPKLPNYIPE